MQYTDATTPTVGNTVHQMILENLRKENSLCLVPRMLTGEQKKIRLMVSLIFLIF